MRALLDINVVIALFDPDHTFHNRAHDWWASAAPMGWASCPLTENGIVRIMSTVAYSSQLHLTPGDLINRLQIFASQTNHEFWPDDLSLCDEGVFAKDRIHSSRKLTDLYLLALAARHGGCLATFDKGISLSGVRSAKPENLCVI